MSCDVRKPDFCLCENKGADQLPSNFEADQRLCVRYTDSAISLLPKSEISSFKPASVTVTASESRFMSDLVRNPEDRFSRFNPEILILGNWDAQEGVYEEDNEQDVLDKLESRVVDEDADVDETDNIEDWDTEALAVS